MRVFVRGFSLLELLISLSLVLLVGFFAERGFAGFSRHAKSQAAIQQLYTDIRLAQSEAIRRGHVVVLCGSQDALTCDGAWNRGRLIQDEETHDRLRYDSSPKQSGRWVWRSSFGRNDYLKFAPTGFTLGQQGRFYYYSGAYQKKAAWMIVVARSGRLRLEQA